MPALLDQLVTLDRAVSDAVEGLRWGPATAVFVLASAWWVKSVLFLLAGAVRDLRARALPITTAVIAAAYAAGDAASVAVKAAVDRPRPPLDDPSIGAAIDLPASASFPSGHATTAFAAAAAVAVLMPRLRWPALALAALVALSRVYLGVHFAFDVLAGALLGTLIGAGLALAARRFGAGVDEAVRR